ncbi:MAG TPA: MFS transporter [Candidatus Limnocylindria bacterium]|jgi:EmrB/QacA subfamily drug resistance transporter|nr:MFS transporter [Candidatus Limnocylindria bacterium]
MTARSVTLIVACTGVLLAQIDTSVVNLAVHRIHAAFGGDPGALRWVIDGYNLTYAAAILSAGALGDRLGRRRMFLVGTAVFAGGSLGCTLAPNAATLIAARAVTGLGAALEVPATLALLSGAYPEGKPRAHALGIWASMNGLAFVIGPIVGGLLADALGWRSLFAIVIPFALAALVLARAIDEQDTTKARSLDLVGQMLAACALGALAFAGMAAGTRAWPTAFAWFAPGVLAFAAFVARERRTAEPLVDLRLFADRPFSAATFVTMTMTFGMYGLLYLTPLALQTFQHETTFQAALALLPMSVVFVVTSSFSGKIVPHVGVRASVAAGMAAMGSGCLVVAFGGTEHAVSLAIGLALTGLGMGLVTGPVLGFAVGRAPAELAGTASGIGNAARMLGATLGVAVLGGAFAHATNAGALRSGFAGGGLAQLLGALVAALAIRRTRRAADHSHTDRCASLVHGSTAGR